MSAKINGNLPAADGMPWPKDASLDVQQVRRAITDNLDNEPVDTEMAPMMAELLARLESFAAPEAPNALAAPPAPSAEGPPSPETTMRSMSSACHKLRRLGDEQPQALHQDVRQMVETVERFVHLKQEVVMRSSDPRRRG